MLTFAEIWQDAVGGFRSIFCTLISFVLLKLVLNNFANFTNLFQDILI